MDGELYSTIEHAWLPCWKLIEIFTRWRVFYIHFFFCLPLASATETLNSTCFGFGSTGGPPDFISDDGGRTLRLKILAIL